MKYNVLVTGGAGFIGSHIVDRLVDYGHQVTIFDCLDPQVHGSSLTLPEYVNPAARFVLGDIRDRDTLARVMRDQDVIYHEAAAVGVGQSMYEISRYTEYNSLGGANLLDILVNDTRVRDRVSKVIVASSMSIYGEGLYRCPSCGPVSPPLRATRQLEERVWEMRCPSCSAVCTPMPTHEGKPLQPTSIYAITKRDHEEMFISTGTSYKIPTVALRYFNVYGPRQALSNPYTGVAAIFSGRILNENPPVIYEDGLQSRDFIHVSDIVQANMLAMLRQEADYQVFNVGTGSNTSILEVAQTLIRLLKPGLGLEPVVAQSFREGDIRHCYADISRIQEKLGFAPKVRYEDGVADLVDWVSRQTSEDRFEEARRELEKRGLTN